MPGEAPMDIRAAVIREKAGDRVLIQYYLGGRYGLLVPDNRNSC